MTDAPNKTAADRRDPFCEIMKQAEREQEWAQFRDHEMKQYLDELSRSERVWHSTPSEEEVREAAAAAQKEEEEFWWPSEEKMITALNDENRKLPEGVLMRLESELLGESNCEEWSVALGRAIIARLRWRE